MHNNLYDQNPEDYFKTPKELEEKQKVAEQEIENQKVILNCYHRLFSTEDGKKVLKDLSWEVGEHHQLFYSGQVHIQNYMLGRRSVILFIREQLKRSIK